MKRKGLLSIAFCGSMLSVILAGCNGGAASQTTAAVSTTAAEGDKSTKPSVVTEPTELTYIFADGDEGAKAAMNEIVNRFNETYPDIKVKIQPGNGGAYNEFIKTKESVGEFPDVLEMRETSVYSRAGMLEPLPDDIVSLFKTTVPFDDKVYTAPLGGENTQGIIYNKKYFDENGLKEPETYDDFIKLCEDIKAKGDMAPLVIGGQDIWHIGFWFHKAYNDQVLSKDPDFIKHCYEGSKNFSDPTMQATFEELKSIFSYAQDGWVSTPDAQITTFLVSDMSAMMYSGTHMFSQIETADPSFEMGWFPVPSPDGKLRLVGGGGASGLAISAECAKDANKKAAAEEFIRFFFSPDEYKIYCDKLNAIPSTVADPNMDASPVFKEVVEAVDQADELGNMWNGLVGDNELPPDFRNFMYKTVVEVIQGQRDVPSACEELNKTWEVAKKSFNPLTAQ